MQCRLHTSMGCHQQSFAEKRHASSALGLGHATRAVSQQQQQQHVAGVCASARARATSFDRHHPFTESARTVCIRSSTCWPAHPARRDETSFGVESSRERSNDGQGAASAPLWRRQSVTVRKHACACEKCAMSVSGLTFAVQKFSPVECACRGRSDDSPTRPPARSGSAPDCRADATGRSV